MLMLPHSRSETRLCHEIWSTLKVVKTAPTRIPALALRALATFFHDVGNALIAMQQIFAVVYCAVVLRQTLRMPGGASFEGD